MARSSDDDDAPRWELPVWEEEPPSRSPSEAVPRWEPERHIPRRQPQRRPAAETHGRVPAGTSAASSQRVPAPKRSLLARPFAWWAAHPWVVVWGLVFAAPAAVLLLRALDESGYAALVQPATWALAGLFVVALVLAMMASARRSAIRLTLGTVGVLAALTVLLWPVTQVTLGRTGCPGRAVGDLGVSAAGRTLEAWRRGAGVDEGWRTGRADGAWLDRSRTIDLLDYEFVDSGCWERAAPIDAARTWHEFRVTVKGGGSAALSKSVVVHTAVGADGWKITAIEGPHP
jgi:hypothetical protein